MSILNQQSQPSVANHSTGQTGDQQLNYNNERQSANDNRRNQNNLSLTPQRETVGSAGMRSKETVEELKEHIVKLNKKSEDRKTSLKLLYSILTTKEKESDQY